VTIRGVIFDLDGTIVDVPYDWRRIKTRLGVRGESIIGYLNGLEEPEKSRKWAVLRGYEDTATRRARLRRGMRSFLRFLAERGVKTALVSNNSRENVEFMVRKFGLSFNLVLSRDSGYWKPSGAPFLHALRRLRLARRAAAVVGDSHFDVLAAAEAGISRVYLLGRDGVQSAGPAVVVCPGVSALRRELAGLMGPLCRTVRGRPTTGEHRGS
jgi:HAD superfamily hydrolase (TIGR01549 family)